MSFLLFFIVVKKHLNFRSNGKLLQECINHFVCYRGYFVLSTEVGLGMRQ